MLCTLGFCSRAKAQQLEPRAFSPSPIGTNFVATDSGRSSGSVNFDPPIPITDEYAELNAPVMCLGHTFGPMGRRCLFTGTVPYADLGSPYPVKSFAFDLYAGVWFFTENSSFYVGQSNRTQSPRSSFPEHVSYSVRGRLWLACNSTWYGAEQVE
jgi:hypothetical protein